MRSIALLLLTVPLLWSCVPLDQHAALREAYNKLDAERTATRAATQTAKNESAKLAGELKRVQEEVKDLEVKLQKANQEMADLSAQLEATKKTLAAKEAARPAPTPEAKPAPQAKKPLKGKKP